MSRIRAIAMGAAVALSAALTGQAFGETKEAASTADKSVTDIRDCMAKNLVRKGALRDLAIEVYDKEGKINSLRMRLFWKPSKTGGTRVNLRVLEPLPMRGSGYLLLQEGMKEEVFFHLAGADKALRITGQDMSKPLWGTDFSYGEIKQVLGMLVTGETQRIGDSSVSDRASYVLDTQTKVEEMGYRKVMSYVDQSACVLLKSEFFPKPDKPRKVLEADLSTLLQADTYWTVLGYKMSDLSRGTYTLLSLTDLSFNERLHEKLFDPKTFYQSPE